MADSTSSPFLPPRWVIRFAWRVHRALYRWTGGRKGLRRPHDTTYGLMHVITTGRTSGQKRPVMLAYFNDDDRLVTMAMNGWGAPEPQWWLNLQADPEAEVTLVDGTTTMVGRAADEAEQERLWDRWRHYDKDLDGYAGRRPTETAVVILEPASA